MVTRSFLKIAAARVGALCYIAWGHLSLKCRYDIYVLGAAQFGIAQGRLFQLAGYILSIALFAIFVGAFGNWRGREVAYWLNLLVIGWADGIWVLVVVLPGYVPAVRGLIPPAIFVLGAELTSAARTLDRQGAAEQSL